MYRIIWVIINLLFLLKSSYAQTEMLVDIDGNSYKTIKVGNQIWMAENLRTTRLNDGTQISYIKDRLVWSETTIPSYCWDNNDERQNNKLYGALYNWFSVETGKLCPVGWHVPSDQTGINEPYIPISYRDENGLFWLLHNRSSIWTSTVYSLYQAYHIVIFFDNRQAQREFSNKRYGIPVRCVKDAN